MACTSETISLRIAHDRKTRLSMRDRMEHLWYRLEQWRERSRQRRALLNLDDRLLRDIGVSRADAEREGRKPFWQD